MDVPRVSPAFSRLIDHPRVKAAQARIDAAQSRLDRAEVALHGDWDKRLELYRSDIDALWEQQRTNGVTAIAAQSMLIMVVGGGLAVNVGVSMVPALAPYRNLLTIGAWVAGWKYLPELMGRHVIRPVAQRIVNRQMDHRLARERELQAETLQRARAQLDEQLRLVAAEAASLQAAHEAQARQSAPAPAISVATEEVRIGGISLPRRATAAGASAGA